MLSAFRFGRQKLLGGEGDPWMVFCHEWVQIQNGTVEAMRLTSDLKCAAGEPVTLFHGSDAPWSKPWAENNYVTDGPFLYCENGKLMMLWSSFSAGGYTMGVAESTSGKVTGPWIQHEKPLCDADGGHGMVFHDLTGKRFYVVHTPNSRQKERPLRQDPPVPCPAQCHRYQPASEYSLAL